jgi:hypothetical protein
MNLIWLKCPNKHCTNVISVTCVDSDQLVLCTKCLKAFTFLNLAHTHCPKCSKHLEVPLNITNPIVLCEACGKRYNFQTPIDKSKAVEPYKLEEEEEISYCGRGYFAGFESQVDIAKGALKKIEEARGRLLGIFPKNPKKAIFINMVKLPANRKFPIEYLRLLHAYCNFKIHMLHENAKYVGFIAGFIDGELFQKLISKHGLVDIWIKDENLYNELKGIPALSKYMDRFKVL